MTGVNEQGRNYGVAVEGMEVGGVLIGFPVVWKWLIVDGVALIVGSLIDGFQVVQI